MLIDNLAKLSRSSRNAVFAAMVIIAAVATYNWIVAPHTAYLFAARRYESIVGDIIEKNKTIGIMVDTRRKKLEELREQFAQVQSTLFTANKAKEFFSDLQTISEETGCAVYSLNFIASKEVPIYTGSHSEKTARGGSDEEHLESRLGPKGEQSEHISDIAANGAVLSVAGVYSNIIRLMKRLQARTQKVWIESLEMENLDYDSDQVKCDMTIKIYTIQDKEATVYE